MIAIIIAVTLLICACTSLLWWYSVLRKFKSLDGMPGPKTIPFLGSALELGNTPQQFLNTLLKFERQYGEVYKIYITNELRVIICNPELTEQVMSSNVHITKSNAYDLLKPWLGVGLLTSTGKKWKARRKLITPTFHFKILDQFIEVFNSCGTVLIDKLSKEAGKDPVDIYPYINLFSLDVICETSMGVKVLAQQGQNTEYIEAVREYLEIFTIRTFSGWKRFNVLFKMTSTYTTYKECLKILHAFTNNIIRRRQLEKSRQKIEPTYSDDGIKRKTALLDMLLESENKEHLSNEDIREEIDTFMFEGHDTTTSGIAFAILCLAENPEVQEKVYDEICSVVGTERNVHITMQHLQDSKYLEMVLKETQRLYPSVPVFERILEVDWSSGGYDFPKGIFFTFLVFALHRNEKYFPDPEKFDPDRFLPENQAQRHNFAYVPFSAGARNCVGQKFAMLEMKTVIIKIVRNFRILPIPNFKPDLGLAGILKSFNGVWVRLQPRDTV